MRSKLEKVEKRAFLFQPKLWKHFVPEVDFQPNKDLHRNGRNHTLCSRSVSARSECFALEVYHFIKDQSKDPDLLSCWRWPAIMREMCPLASLPGEHLKMRCLYPRYFKFYAKPELPVRSPSANFPLLKDTPFHAQG